MASKTLAMLRETAQAATLGYRNAIWSEEGAPELSSAELARRKRMAISEAQAYLAATTGWPAEQIHYDPLFERTIQPYDSQGEPLFFPDEVRFGARALLKESDWWEDKLVPADRLSKMRRVDETEPDGGAGKMSRFLAAAAVGTAGAMLLSGEASAAGVALAEGPGFVPVGYSLALGLVDELVFVAPRHGASEAGRLSFLDMLALVEENKPQPRLFPPPGPKAPTPPAELPAIDWTKDKVEPQEPPEIDWEEEKEEEEEEEKKEKDEEEEPEEKEEEKKKEEPEEEEEEEKRKSTLVYRLKRTALFSTSPSSFEWSSEPEKVFVISEPEEMFEPVPSAGIDRAYPLSLRRVPVSQFADEEVRETVKAPLMVGGVYPRAVLVTSGRLSSEIPVAPPLREIARRRELFMAPPAAKRKFVSAGPEPFDPRLARVLRRAALKQPISKPELKTVAASRSFTTLGEVYWRVATSGFPEVKAAEEAVPGMTRARSAVFASVRRLGKMMRLAEPMALSDATPLPPGYQETPEPMMKLITSSLRKSSTELSELLKEHLEPKERKRLFERAAKTAKAAEKKAEEERRYVVMAAGAPEKRAGYRIQTFRVVRRPAFARSLLDVSEFEVVRRTDEAGKPGPAPAGKRRRTDTAKGRAASAAKIAGKIAGTVMKLIAPLSSMGLKFPPAASAESFKGLRLRSRTPAGTGFRGPLDSSRMASMLTPVASMFLPTVARRRKPAGTHPDSGRIVAPGLVSTKPGELAALTPGHKPGALATDGWLEPAEMRSAFGKLPGVLVEVVPGEETEIGEAVAKRDWEMTLLSPETRKRKVEADGEEAWAIDHAELISPVPLRSRLGGRLYHLGPKTIGTEPPEPRYPSVADGAEPPVRRSRRAVAEEKAPEAAAPVPVKQVSSDPLKDFDERVLDELMFALKRRMEIEHEGRGGLS